MHQCEKMIFDDIENITKERLAPTVIDIKRDIKYAFWHGFINEKIYINLLSKLQEKVDLLWD